jgi:hypothetical protein
MRGFYTKLKYAIDLVLTIAAARYIRDAASNTKAGAA